MKRIIIISFTVLAAISLNSCEDYLEKNPTDEISEATFWGSANDFNMALTACYGTMQDVMYAVGMPFWDVIADAAFNPYNYYGANTIPIGPLLPSTGGYISDVYNKGYRYIARYNLFLTKLTEYEGDDISSAVKTAYEAEVKFMRAFQYLQLYKCYGSVPLVTEPLTFEDMHVAKSEASLIIGQVMSDIDFAIANLSSNHFQENGGHIVKAAAQVLKARALLFDSYDDGGNAIASVMNQVKAITSDIMAGPYALDEHYRELWFNSAGIQETTLEFIHSIKFLAPNDNGNFFWGSPPHFVYLAWRGAQTLPGLIEEYEFEDGTPFDVSNPLYVEGDEFANRDPRLTQTHYKDSIVFEDGQVYTGFLANTPWAFWRPSDPVYIFDNTYYGYPVDTDYPLMRYAEVLLMHAEAVNEVDGPSGEVYDAINAIRNRVDMPDLPAGLSKEEMRDRIRHERRIETCFEGLRYDDLKRWKIAHIALNMTAEEGVTVRNFDMKNYHWPLPEAAIQVNDALVQNPDY